MLQRKKMNEDERMNGASPIKIQIAASLFAQQKPFKFYKKTIITALITLKDDNSKN